MTDKAMIQHLNSILKNELTAINQYFMHAKFFAHWGLSKLAAKVRTESIDEMKHADVLIDRILYLKGLPNLQDLDKLMIGQTVTECLDCDLKLELAAFADLKAAIKHAESVQDYVSRDLLQNILAQEEEHADWIETQLELIKRVGLENYCNSML